MVGGGHFGRQSLSGETHLVQSKTILLEPSALSAALTDLWHQRLLCDIVLRTTTTTTTTTTVVTASSTTSPTSRRSPTNGPGPGARPSPGPLARSRPPVASNPIPPQASRGSLAEAEADAAVGDGDGDGETVEGASVQALAGDVAVAVAGRGSAGEGPGGGDGEAGAATQPTGDDADLGEIEDLPAHRVVLAATCDYFRALMTGAGAEMSDMRAAAAAGAAAAAAAACGGSGGGSAAADGPPAAAAAAAAGAAAAAAVAVVVLPGLDGWALRLAVGALYERRVEVAADNLEGLLSAASYLGAGALLDACAAFMRSNLGLQTCLPLLLLAWRYNMGPLREELMSYVCRRFSVLVRTRLSADGSAAPGSVSELRLSSLPLELLTEVLRSEELLAECESDVLQCAVEWLAEQHCSHWDDPTATAENDSSSTIRHGSSSSSSSSCVGIPAGRSTLADGGVSAAAQELVRLVHWAALPETPHLNLHLQPTPTPTRGSSSTSHAAHVRALADLLEAHARETQQTHGSVGGPIGGQAVLPPAVLRLRRLLGELQATTRAPQDLAPSGPDGAMPPSPTQLTAAATGNGLDGISLSDALRRIGPVVPSGVSGSRNGVGGGGGGGGRPRRHLASCLLAAGGHDASWRAVKAVEMYDPRTDQWVAGPSLLQGLSFTGAAMVPGSGSGIGFGSGLGSGSGSSAPLGGCGAVFLVGGTPLCSSVWRLPWGADGPMGRGWEPCPPLLMPRAHAGVVAVAGTLTVLGGRSQVQQVQHVLNTVEVLNPAGGGDADTASTSTGATSSAAAAVSAGFTSPGGGGGGWQRGPDMVLPRSAHACAVLGGRIFALGGAGGGAAAAAGGGGGGGLRGASTGGSGGGGGTHRSGEFLDLGSGRWQLLGCDMATERKYMAAASHGGRIYVAGGVNDSRTRLSSLEALDPREGRWTPLERMSGPRSSHAMAALGGCLYVAGGQCSSAELMAGSAVAATAAGTYSGGGGGTAAAAIGIGPAAPWGWGPAGRQTFAPPLQPSPFLPVGSPGVIGPYGTSPPMAPYGRGTMALYGSAPGPGGGWGPAGFGLGFGSSGGGAAAAIGGIGGGGGGGEDVAVLSGMECYDVAAGRWRVCAPLSHGGRAGLALCGA
ncbi:hypothetical protein PLESTB_000425100 [Pleodorina starrii]|uniref:BTB domain-containing protein n=1 Tax=Pleodorina starrii TaxID=330485 RepID=A0A9W6EZ63_9CHLO|nr:hypothetical protein PLESTM_001699100 [Pleodorina starrii]GLC50728.1 hypothetical protein PLESTB_000425100 [Pleodorina starrii]GLC74367.1 hypothetical protein PLESTF_001504500 [Pleodorina starrii]